MVTYAAERKGKYGLDTEATEVKTMNKENRIKNIVGWFGILTLAYAAGAVSILAWVGFPDTEFIVRIAVVGVFNGVVGVVVLRSKLKVVDNHASHAEKH